MTLSPSSLLGSCVTCSASVGQFCTFEITVYLAIASICFKFNHPRRTLQCLIYILESVYNLTMGFSLFYTCMHASFLHAVICFYSSGASFESASVYGEASGTIWLDDLVCTGSETSITQCQFNGWGVHNCGHSEDVAISCSSGQFPGPFPT